MASDLWRNTLSQIPSHFGQLVYLASLRNSNTGRYEHWGMTQIFGEEETDRALLAAHALAFFRWICLDLKAQRNDLDLYLSGLALDKRTILVAWLRLAPYRNLTPSTAGPEERRLYLSDFSALLALLQNEHGILLPSSDGSMVRGLES